MVVLGVEAHDAQGGGVGDGPPQLLGRGPVGQGPVQGGHDLARVVAQHQPGQGLHLLVAEAPGPGPVLARGQQTGEAFGACPEQAGQVVGVAPLALLLVAPGRSGLGHEGGQHRGRGVGAQELDGLEGLVGEVDGVAAVEEDVIGRGRGHERAQGRGGHAMVVLVCIRSKDCSIRAGRGWRQCPPGMQPSYRWLPRAPGLVHRPVR